MARPSFFIDPKRLRKLRDEAGLTQLDLIRKAYKVLERSPESSDGTLQTRYQKLERDGRASAKLAKALAQVLETTVDALQGKDMPEPMDYQDKVTEQIRAELEQGSNPALEAELDKYKNRHASSGSEDMIKSFACHIAGRIEEQQLIPDEAELAKLGELTGWSNKQLLNPANVHGCWFVRTTENGGAKYQVAIGLRQVLSVFESLLIKVPEPSRPDMHVSIRRQGTWAKIGIDFSACDEHPEYSMMFTRALPAQDGLRWIEPRESDMFMLDLFEYTAFRYANFVTLNDGPCRPAEVRNLRLKIVEIIDGRERRVAYSAGKLSSMPDHVFNRSDSHNFVVNWLAEGLAEGLRHFVTGYPSEAWKPGPSESSESGFKLRLDPTALSREQERNLVFNNMGYRITLVEALPDGQYRPAPWSWQGAEIAREDFIKQLRKQWAKHGFPAAEDEVVLHFEDIIQEDDLL